MRLRSIVAVVLVATFAGCSPTAKNQTDKQRVTQQWDKTRAKVKATLAKDQYDNGNFDKARVSCNEAMNMDPENASIRVLSAKIAIEQAQMEIADKELRLARQFDSKNVEADYLSGVVYQRWQKPELAYDFYCRAAEKAPSELAFLLAKAEMLVEMDRSPEALKLLLDKVVYFEHSSAIRDAAGQLLIGQKKYTTGLVMLREASILSPDDITVREHLAMALFYAKQYDESASTLNKLLKDERCAKRSDLFATLGQSECELRRYREARDAFDKATKIDPSSAGLWLGLGKSAMELGDQRRAELALRKATSIDPSSNEASLLMGYLRLRQERFQEALEAFQKVSKNDNSDTLSLCMTGYVLEKLGRSNEAIQCYGKALKRNPNDELANKLMAGVQLHD
jgi:Flp pilus assembly protein TadD